MDDLHDETLIIPQAHVVVDLSVEFVERVHNPNDPNFYGLTFASASIGWLVILILMQMEICLP
jgi:hypothetical protein